MKRVFSAVNGVDFRLPSAYIDRTKKEFKQMAVIVFDLDMTVIDSSHRHVSKPDGSIDLAAWFDNCHRVVDDTLLPLAAAVRRLYDAGHFVVLCTARAMQAADWKWMLEHSEQLPHHAFYSREGHFVSKDSPEYADSYYGFIGDARSDELIKLEQITSFVQSIGYETIAEANVILFEDNLKTIAAFEAAGALGVDANWANRSEAARQRKVA
jgi:hypothetical protein